MATDTPVDVDNKVNKELKSVQNILEIAAGYQESQLEH